MVGSMPYSLEKGPYFSVIEDFANGSQARLVQTLTHLRSGGAIADLGAMDSTTLDKGPYTTQGLRDHLNQDWFGWTKSANGAWQDQAAFDAITNPSTGFWVGWYGNCEGIFRQTLIRGCEVALGLAHDEPIPPRTTPRRWHVELFWRCPIPWFEGWVTWRQHGAGRRQGQVTILISTPSHGHPLENTPLRVGEPAGSGYAEDPPGPGNDQGMWVVGQTYQKPWPTEMTASSWLGEWRFPTEGLAYEGQGNVVTVAPPEAEGGVLDPPRRWTPHP